MKGQLPIEDSLWLSKTSVLLVEHGMKRVSRRCRGDEQRHEKRESHGGSVPGACDNGHKVVTKSWELDSLGQEEVERKDRAVKVLRRTMGLHGNKEQPGILSVSLLHDQELKVQGTSSPPSG